MFKNSCSARHASELIFSREILDTSIARVVIG
jgi:hypothetical protein